MINNQGDHKIALIVSPSKLVGSILPYLVVH